MKSLLVSLVLLAGSASFGLVGGLGFGPRTLTNLTEDLVKVIPNSANICSVTSFFREFSQKNHLEITCDGKVIYTGDGLNSVAATKTLAGSLVIEKTGLSLKTCSESDCLFSK